MSAQEKTLARGREFTARGDLLGACRHYEAALAKKPDDAELQAALQRARDEYDRARARKVIASGTCAAHAPGIKTVEVFYGTDRAAIDIPRWDYAKTLRWLLGGVVLAAILYGICHGWLDSVAKSRRIGMHVLIWGLVFGGSFLTFREYWLLRETERRLPLRYGGKRGAGIAFGKVEVSIPIRGQRALAEMPEVALYEITENPQRQFVVLCIESQTKTRFLSDLKSAVEPSGEAFVYIHGYRNTFEDAARRAAQIWHDVSFPGAPVIYSWPSAGTTATYLGDEDSVDVSLGFLKDFLRAVRAESGARKIHLIAHSMGCRALGKALADFSREAQGPRFDEIILAAPDIDADTYKRHIAPRLAECGKRVTVYTSSADDVLSASQVAHANNPRAGQGVAFAFYPGIFAIEVSGVASGHSYIADSKDVLHDVRAVITGLAIKERAWIQRQVTRDGLVMRHFRARR